MKVACVDFEGRTTTGGSIGCCSSLKEEGQSELAPCPTSSKLELPGELTSVERMIKINSVSCTGLCKAFKG